jgi:hypothetical protein
MWLAAKAFFAVNGGTHWQKRSTALLIIHKQHIYFTLSSTFSIASSPAAVQLALVSPENMEEWGIAGLQDNYSVQIR